MENSKTIQNCEKVAKEYNRQMKEMIYNLRSYTLRHKIHNMMKEKKN